MLSAGWSCPMLDALLVVSEVRRKRARQVSTGDPLLRSHGFQVEPCAGDRSMHWWSCARWVPPWVAGGIFLPFHLLRGGKLLCGYGEFRIAYSPDGKGGTRIGFFCRLWWSPKLATHPEIFRTVSVDVSVSGIATGHLVNRSMMCVCPLDAGSGPTRSMWMCWKWQLGRGKLAVEVCRWSVEIRHLENDATKLKWVTNQWDFFADDFVYKTIRLQNRLMNRDSVCFFRLFIFKKTISWK